MKQKRRLNIGKNVWDWGSRTYIMGILNITPDSFSDGGKFNNDEAALKQAFVMAGAGADIIDVGGESTRPGSTVVSPEEEIERVIPIIRILSKNLKIPISVDTYRAKTAEAAIKAGACMINDIWGLKYDSEMASVAAKYNVPVCIMHNRTGGTEYNNLIGDILHELSESIELAHKAGIKEENIIIDPGIGFAKTFEQNLEVMRKLDALKALGYPILLGASRKSFIGKVLKLEAYDRLEGTLAITAAGIMKGCDIVRVHDVLENVRVSKVIDCLERKCTDNG
ncbi:dihydropteroate synthase [Ruminiclostridium sufflavum DSM 19573]|uniref:Dihydropteroate synthase n=1 Tax=Ruminiclostridium sufflavum DSM 19573 TaxID=1121337 RepID=A0A318XMG2_9FIRM|nr:dihydropteroate synthase [Ruminiclostridium sufflavum]PYG87122.1 dihydropteroate synthase [Ruminiclostridium sufflavum DSM 19573]